MALKLCQMTIACPALTGDGAIPSKYTGDGQDVSPPLEWSGAPEGTRGYALLCHDPDAPFIVPGRYGFVHWVLYNIPASTTRIPEGGGAAFTQGVSDFGPHAYGGPMPPPDHGTHRYFFTLFALDDDLALPPGLTMNELLERIAPHVLGMNRLVGTYERTSA
jgi:hypothetical protein